jgi:hypothetical protein
MLAPRNDHSTVADVPSDAVGCSSARTQDADYAIARILRLEHFERFVFVMSVLEKYSDQDCSVLLGCSRQDVGETKRVKACPGWKTEKPFLVITRGPLPSVM